MLESRRVVITGAGQGIGAAIASAMCTYQARAFTIDMNPDAAVDAHGDVSDADVVAEMFAAAVDTMGGIDGLINNVGIAGPTGGVEEIDPIEFDNCLQVNVGSAFRCTKQAVPHMGSGSSIVNISSTAGIYGYPLRSSDAASKWVVVGLTKTWAMELGSRGIGVNAICPGTVDGHTETLRTV
jgi:NAD(P)-dependent dehydrogenase (short-subunit alcohol dehydrogenase family)